MPSPRDVLPLSGLQELDDQPSVAEAIRDCFLRDTPVYPIGGGTSLGFGGRATREGLGLSLSGLNRIIDYPANDMTITVEAGVTMAALASTLFQERQRLPVDVPLAGQATLGGVVATNANGPRRYGSGPLRDYVIGVSAVDGQGTRFKAGGRVVKNVAGYDLCKLLTGCLGTLGVITQVTLRVRPIPERVAVVACAVRGLLTAERLLASLAHSPVAPSAIELVAGPAWDDEPSLAAVRRDRSAGAYLAAVLEGSMAEVEWLTSVLTKEWAALGVVRPAVLDDESARTLIQELVEFPARDGSPLTVQAAILPSATTRFVELLRRLDSACSVQSHAGNGIVRVRFSDELKTASTKSVLRRLQRLSRRSGGNVVVLSAQAMGDAGDFAGGQERALLDMMRVVKREFDPKNLLNPGRLVFR